MRSATGSARTTTLPSAGVCLIAFWIRLNRTRCSFSGFARAGINEAGISASTATPFASACMRIASTVSSTSSSSGTRCSVQLMSPASSRESSNRSSIRLRSASMWVFMRCR